MLKRDVRQILKTNAKIEITKKAKYKGWSENSRKIVAISTLFDQ